MEEREIIEVKCFFELKLNLAYHSHAHRNRTRAQVLGEGDQHTGLHGGGHRVQQIVRFAQDNCNKKRIV